MEEPLAQSILIYLLFLGVCLAVYGLWNRGRAKRRMPVWVLIVLALSPGLLYLPVEIRTAIYGAQFRDVAANTGWELPRVYLKVMSIHEHVAKVLIVEGEDGEHQIANYYWFRRRNGKWEFSGDCRTLWTNLGGSASESSWPPYF